LNLLRGVKPVSRRGEREGRGERRHADRRHQLPHRRRLDRQERGDEHLRLALRESEEAREQVVHVLGREHPGDLDHRHDAEPPVPQRVGDGGEVADEADRGLAVERGSLREPELAVEEVEERAVLELGPEAALVEGREGQEKVGQGAVLVAQEIAKAGGEVACSFHE
jgi:hypothetical protein